MIDEKLIEEEVQKRVGIRLLEIRNQIKMGRDAMKMADSASFGHVYIRGSLAAWEMINDIVDKELTMGTPYDGDFIKRTWKKKEKVVNKISDRILDKSTRDYMHLKSFINDCVENFIEE